MHHQFDQSHCNSNVWLCSISDAARLGKRDKKQIYTEAGLKVVQNMFYSTIDVNAKVSYVEV